PALPRCLSNKINTSLRSKEKPSTGNLTQSFNLRFALVCSITHYGKCPCVGELSPVTLITYLLNCADPKRGPMGGRPYIADIVIHKGGPRCVIECSPFKWAWLADFGLGTATIRSSME
ncbi:MAG: hypothetical protein MJE68_04270, partial [Proteobacteria bacterium]|nr:hypothetical protein [Pseudomonadota bacterium]